MKLTKKDLIYISLFMVIIYHLLFKKEKFTVNLKKDGKGNFVIPGNLKVNGTVGVRRDPDPKIGVVVNGSGLGGALQSNGTLYVYGKSHLMGNVGVRSKPINHIGLYVKGSDLTRGIETNGTAGIGPNDFLKNEDDIHIRRRNGWRYLNYTQRNISADKPRNMAGWAYWSSSYDADADFFIQKKR